MRLVKLMLPVRETNAESATPLSAKAGGGAERSPSCRSSVVDFVDVERNGGQPEMRAERVVLGLPNGSELLRSERHGPRVSLRCRCCSRAGAINPAAGGFQINAPRLHGEQRDTPSWRRRVRHVQRRRRTATLR